MRWLIVVPWLLGCGNTTPPKNKNTSVTSCTSRNQAGMLVCTEERNLTTGEVESSAMACSSVDGGVVGKNTPCTNHGGGGCQREYDGNKARVLFLLDQTVDQVKQICASSQETYVP